MTYRHKVRELKSIQLGFLEYMETNPMHNLDTKLKLCAEITSTQLRISKIERMALHEAERECLEYFIEINSIINGKD